MNWPIVIRPRIVSPGDARGWIGLGTFALVLILLWMMWSDKNLLNNDFFKVIATAIILTGWNQGPVGWAYQATKGGGELAESSARIAENAAGVPQPEPKPKPAPQNAAAAAQQTAEAAANEADAIAEQTEEPKP
jgi:hypothetical protein